MAIPTTSISHNCPSRCVMPDLHVVTLPSICRDMRVFHGRGFPPIAVGFDTRTHPTTIRSNQHASATEGARWGSTTPELVAGAPYPEGDARVGSHRLRHFNLRGRSHHQPLFPQRARLNPQPPSPDTLTSTPRFLWWSIPGVVPVDGYPATRSLSLRSQPDAIGNGPVRHGQLRAIT
jgi:hypothetical protein